MQKYIKIQSKQSVKVIITFFILQNINKITNFALG